MPLLYRSDTVTVRVSTAMNIKGKAGRADRQAAATGQLSHLKLS